MDKPVYNLVSFSGGKDSTAMLLGMLERNMPIDCILFCDTGLEFPQMYEHIDKVERDIGRPITRLKPDRDFEYYMFEHEVHRGTASTAVAKYGAGIHGYGWAGPRMRWCTTKLKDKPRENFLAPLRKQYCVIEYVGIAADETYRLERERNKQADHSHPLVDWNMTEADCLAYCKKHGYDWGGLYEHFNRVSCWCCPLQSLDDLRNLRKYHPDLWKQLGEWDKRTWRDYRAGWSVAQLETRFAFEDERIKAGLPVKGGDFFNALRGRMEAVDDGR